MPDASGMFCIPRLFGLFTHMKPLINPQAGTSSCRPSRFTAPGLTLLGEFRACELQMQETQLEGCCTT